jgi:hypothetical protein
MQLFIYASYVDREADRAFKVVERAAAPDIIVVADPDTFGSVSYYRRTTTNQAMTESYYVPAVHIYLED